MKLWVKQNTGATLLKMSLELWPRDRKTRLLYPVPTIIEKNHTNKSFASPQMKIEGKENEIPTASVEKKSGLSDMSLVLIICVSLLLAILFAVYFVRRRKAYAKNHDHYESGDDSKSVSSSGSGGRLSCTTAFIPGSHVSIGEILGRGSFGAVYSGMYLGKHVAIKVLFEQSEHLQFEHEVALLSNLHHPNIVQFMGTCYLESLGASFITEYMENGDLRKVLQKAKHKEIELDWVASSSFSKASIAIDVISGLVYLHALEQPILHRDLKSRNILLSTNFIAKIGDFGVSRTLSETTTMTTVGSNLWAAPEVLRGNRYDEKADVYSFGVVLSELV